MTERNGRPWPTYLLGLAAIGAVLAAYLVVGAPSQSSATTTRTVTAQRGVVQSTVSGSGNVEAAKQLNLGFKTSGVVSHIYVSQGQHVVQGQLLAELDPESAEVTLEQERATLKTAEANLGREEETDGEGSGSTGTGRADASAASVDYSTQTGSAVSSAGAGTSGQGGDTNTAGTTGTAATEGATGSQGSTTSGEPASQKSTGRAGEASKPGAGSSKQGASRKASTGTSSSGDGSGSTLSSAARAANIASASAAVKSDRLAVQSDEEALANTKLYAPETGTLVTLSGEVGETVSATGTTRSSQSKSSSEGSGSGASSAASALGASAGSRESSSGSTDSSSSSSFAVISDLSSMQLVVPLSESEIGEVKDGQPATVTIEALESRKLAAEVVSIATLPSSDSGVVSYDVTFDLDQLTEGLRPGMSATAEVVVKQAEGVNVPSSAITAGQVTVLKSGKQVHRSVLTGLAGESTTIVVSGLSAGETVVLPAARSSSSASSPLSRLGSRLGAGGLGGGAFPGGGAGFAARAFGG
jgi:multidrug efflux pump subunit AcrA (membrane-fusion protein)